MKYMYEDKNVRVAHNYLIIRCDFFCNKVDLRFEINRIEFRNDWAYLTSAFLYDTNASFNLSIVQPSNTVSDL